MSDWRTGLKIDPEYVALEAKLQEMERRLNELKGGEIERLKREVEEAEGAAIQAEVAAELDEKKRPEATKTRQAADRARKALEDAMRTKEMLVQTMPIARKEVAAARERAQKRLLEAAREEQRPRVQRALQLWKELEELAEQENRMHHFLVHTAGMGAPGLLGGLSIGVIRTSNWQLIRERAKKLGFTV